MEGVGPQSRNVYFARHQYLLGGDWEKVSSASGSTTKLEKMAGPLHGSRFDQMTLYFISRLLIDAGEANREDYTSLLADTLQNAQAKISQIVITHWHHDHLGGLPGVLDRVCKCG